MTPRSAERHTIHIVLFTEHGRSPILIIVQKSHPLERVLIEPRDPLRNRRGKPRSTMELARGARLFAIAQEIRAKPDHDDASAINSKSPRQ